MNSVTQAMALVQKGHLLKESTMFIVIQYSTPPRDLFLNIKLLPFTVESVDVTWSVDGNVHTYPELYLHSSPKESYI